MSKENNQTLICTERGCKAPQQEDGSECQAHYEAKNLELEISVYYGNITMKARDIKNNKPVVGKFTNKYIVEYFTNKLKEGKFKVVEVVKGNGFNILELK